MATIPVFATLTGASAKVGATVTLTTVSAASVNSTITITGPKEANGMLVTNVTSASGKGTGTLIFARVSGEAAPTATAADVPIPSGQTVVIQNPVPVGTVGIAAAAAVTGTPAKIYFTPVEIKLGT